MDNNEYILIDADGLISDLRAIVSYCDEHMYKHVASKGVVSRLPRLDKPYITLHLYTRDSDPVLNSMLKRVCDGCKSTVVRVLKPDGSGKHKISGGVSLGCGLLKHGQYESLMEDIPEEWTRPICVSAGERR